MTNLNGVGANLVNVNSLYGVKKNQKASDENAVEKTSQETVANAVQNKPAEDILTSMHNYGVQNFITPKIQKMKQDPQMAQRIGEFMANFEDEVQKGLQVISQEFPSMHPSQALDLAAKSALKAAEL